MITLLPANPTNFELIWKVSIGNHFIAARLAVLADWCCRLLVRPNCELYYELEKKEILSLKMVQILNFDALKFNERTLYKRLCSLLWLFGFIKRHSIRTQTKVTNF